MMGTSLQDFSRAALPRPASLDPAPQQRLLTSTMAAPKHGDYQSVMTDKEC